MRKFWSAALSLALAFALLLSVYLYTSSDWRTNQVLASDTGVVDSSTLDGKVVVGYQGWFRCPGDGSHANRWSHWATKGDPTADTLQVDLYPDLSDFKKENLCEVPSLTIGGKPAYLYSAWNPKIVSGHFNWMRQYNIDGAFAQRFIADIPRLRNIEGDRVLKNVRDAAEEHGRIFAVEYDVSGANPATLVTDIEADWLYIRNVLKLSDSKAYQHDHGKPVVSIWGLGFGDTKHVSDPAEAQAIITWFKTKGDASVMGGVPPTWRTLNGDSSSDERWSAVYQSLDSIQPWTVGRYKDKDSAAKWASDKVAPDLAKSAASNQLYMPVIFAGFSWSNLTKGSRQNLIPRQGGDFFWQQAYAASRSGARCLKIAMFDEVNEGTAIFKVVSSRSEAPDQGSWLTLDADGKSLPSDWYLRLTYEIAKAVHAHSPLPQQIPPHPGP